MKKMNSNLFLLLNIPLVHEVIIGKVVENRENINYL